MNNRTISPRLTFQLDIAARRRASTLRLASCLLFVLCVLSHVSAQSQTTEVGQTSAPPVVASATSRGARFVAPSNVVEMRLEVFSSTGEKVFDSAFRRGSVLDWDASGAQQPGVYAPDDSYLCVVTVRDLSGSLRQRLSLAKVQTGNVTLRAAAREELLVPQAQAWAASREAQSLVSLAQDGENVAHSIVSEQEAQAMIVTAHDEQAGQVTSTTGALTFRTGDLFAGKEVERVRIPPEGNVGIGTAQPKAKLDVAGDIRSTGFLRLDKGIEFADGTVQTTGLSGRKDSEGNSVANATGSGTQNKLAKWTDNSGTLGDSVVPETAGKLGIGTASPEYEITLFGNDVGLQLISSATGTTTNDGFRFGISSVNDAFLWNQEATDMFFGTSGTERMRIKTTGNVGIGTSTPAEKLEVAGNVKLTGTNNGVIFPDGTTQTTASTGGVTGTGTTNTVPLWTDATALGNSVITQSGGSVGIGVPVPLQKLDVAGNVRASGSVNAASANIVGSLTVADNLLFVFPDEGQVIVEGVLDVDDFITTSTHYSIGFDRVLSIAGTDNVFVGDEAGEVNGAGANNSFFGKNAGLSNVTGSDNSFFGRNAGAANTVNDNSFFGASAGAANTSGGRNAFFGKSAGAGNTEGEDNSFFGASAGVFNTTGSDNSFFGAGAGGANSDGRFNSVFGDGAGSNNSSGDGNTFVGRRTGLSNTTEDNNTFIGANSNGFEGITNATAIGANAVVTQSDSLVLGNGVKVGVGTSIPKDKLHVGGGNVLIDSAGNGLILKSPNGLICAKLTD